MSLRCGVCGQPWSDVGGGFCSECGAHRWIEAPEPEPSPAEDVPGVQIRGLDDVDDLHPVQVGGVLSEALEGIVLGLVILLWGPPGSGKSTLAAELGANLAAHGRGVCWWLDREQLNRSLIKACFVRSGVPEAGLLPSRLRIVSPYEAGDPNFKPIGWREAFRVIPKNAPVVVIDSLQAWAGEHDAREQNELLLAVRGLGATVIVISQATKGGDAAGRLTNQHNGDATINIQPHLLTVNKCRWRSAPVSFPRTAVIARDDDRQTATDSKKSIKS